jgi:hypothetical protein
MDQREGRDRLSPTAGGSNGICTRTADVKERAMLDILLLAAGTVFFVAAIIYEYACDRF